MFKGGEIAFFKLAQKTAKRKANAIQFKGMGFRVFLGHVPPFAKDPPSSVLFQLMGQIGYLTFDDVGEFLGEEAGRDCVAKFEKKYYGEVTPDQAVIGENNENVIEEKTIDCGDGEKPKPSGLVSLSGRPLVTGAHVPGDEP